MTITRKQKCEEKQLYRRFKRLINNISHDQTWTWLRKGNFKRETESLQLEAQNNAIRTNHIKARIEKTQQNSKCRLCSDRDETINHIISECSKLAQKEYKTRHDWVGKVIHWETCKKFEFDYTNKWYKHNQAPVLFSEVGGSFRFDCFCLLILGVSDIVFLFCLLFIFCCISSISRSENQPFFIIVLIWSASFGVVV